MKYLTYEILKYRSQLDDDKIEPGIVHSFVITDSELTWKKHIIKNKDNPSIQYYIQNPIEYKFNNEGFRTPDDFNSSDEGNIYLGCSHTFGIGHHLENTWSYKLNNVIGGKFWNLSIGGTGVTTHFRLLLAYYKNLKIKNIFHYAPMYHRYEFLENKRPQSYIVANYNENWLNTFGSLMEKSLLTNEQVEFNWVTYTHAISSIAYEIGANYYLIQGSTGWHGKDDSLQARDLLHYTTLYQHKIYQDFLKIYDLELYKKFKNEQQPILDIKSYIKNTNKSML
jgi:hypothetical protein